MLGRGPDFFFIPREGAKESRAGVGRPATLDLWAHPGFHQLYEWDDRAGAYRLRNLAPERRHKHRP